MKLCVSVLIYHIIIVEVGVKKIHRQVRGLTHNYHKTTSCDTFLGLTTLGISSPLKPFFFFLN